MATLLSPSQECHPFLPFPLAHDLVVSPTPISSGKVVACHEASDGGLEGAHEKFLDRIAGIQVAEQPHVTKNRSAGTG